MKLSAKQRAALPDSDFGIPETRQFPIHDKNHVKAALRFVKFAPPGKKKELITNIYKRAKELGMSINIPAHEQVTPDISNGMYVKSIEASNVGTLEPIVGASETIVAGGGTSYLSDDDNPSFGAKVMDYVLRRKIIREDTVLDEGAVLSTIKCINDLPMNDEHKISGTDDFFESKSGFLKLIEDYRKANEDTPDKYQYNHQAFSNFEKTISSIIARGQTRDMMKYLTLSNDFLDENKALNVAKSWQYVSINAAENIVKILHDKDLNDKVAADRIYHLICTCPESDFIYLMAVLYRGIFNDSHRIRFSYIAEYIANKKTVFKGLTSSAGYINRKIFGPTIKDSEGFTVDEINKYKTCFGNSEAYTAITRLENMLWNRDNIYVQIQDLDSCREVLLNELIDESLIKGYLIIRNDNEPYRKFYRSIVLVKPAYNPDVGLLMTVCDDNYRPGRNFIKAYFFRNEDITKLVDIALRIKAKYPVEGALTGDKRKAIIKMLEDVGFYSDISNPINVSEQLSESVASIFKDAKKMALAAMRRIHVNKDGDVSINLKDELTLANYSETHRLLQADLKSDNLSGLKMNIAYVFSLITIIETKYVFGKEKDKYSQEYKDAIKLRGMLISDFNTGLNAIRKKEPSFSFIKFYKDSGYEAAVYKFNTSAITNLSSSKLIETVFQNILKFGR